MTPTAAAVFALAVAPVQSLPTALWQVAPEVKVRIDGGAAEPMVTKPRAVVLIHGLQFHPIRTGRVARPDIPEWVRAKSDLVEALAADSDVYGFGYAQTLPVDAVALTPGLGDAIGRLRAVGYREIVLVGHSAGGLVARQFVERFPKAGVTKVIQVASPNAGSGLAAVRFGLPKPQVPFIRSLAPEPRVGAAKLVETTIPAGVEFCCVVCKVPRLSTDALVRLDSQWPPELQKQGVPAVLVSAVHFEAMKAPHAVERIAELAREKLVRWTPEQVEQGRDVMFGKDADAAAAARRPGLRVFRAKP